MHRDWNRRLRYVRRHWKDLFHSNGRPRADPRTPGYMSMFLLWGNSPDFAKAEADTRRRFRAFARKGTFDRRLRGWWPRDDKRSRRWAERRQLRGGRAAQSSPLPACTTLPRHVDRSSGRPVQQCLSPTKRVVSWPRRFSRTRCEQQHRRPGGIRGYTMRASCAAFLNLPKSKSKSKRRRRSTPASVPRRYVAGLDAADERRQREALRRSRRAYRRGKRVGRPTNLKSFRSRESPHVRRAKRLYNVDSVGASKEYAKATGCTRSGLARIVRKGAGAYFSSGSRPNQTAQSWGRARLASATTGGNAARYDMHILEETCGPASRALRLARRSVRNRPPPRPRKTRL